MAFKFHYARACVFALLMSMGHTMADSAEEKEKCVEQLTGIATCLPYVGGDAIAPTPDCCSGLKQAMKNNKKCICIVIKDRDDPELGLNINLTLALGLPSLCKATDNFSQCPSLLHLDPKSAEAQCFNQLGQKNNTGSSTSPTLRPASDENCSSRKGPGTARSDACHEENRFLKSLVTLVGGFLIWF